MIRYLIIAQNQMTAKALRNILSLSWPETILESAAFEKVVPTVVMDGTRLTPDQQFGHLAGRIQAELAGSGQAVPVGQAIVLVDHFDLSKADPMSSGWDATVAMLILAFPEIRWIFGVLQGVSSQKVEIRRWHSLKAFLCGPQADPLFDGSGLRNALRVLIVAQTDIKGNKVAPYVPTRTSTAAALDDEESYAYFNAYTAYRFGFRAFPITRNDVAKALFAEDKPTEVADMLLSLEDVYISYPDKNAHEHYSDLGSDAYNGRRKLLPGLEDVSYRIFVTTAHRHAGDAGTRHQSLAYVRSSACVSRGKADNCYGKIVMKPYSGMFSLWQRSGLARRLKNGERRGLAPGFVWPLPKSDGRDSDTGHSAPGRLLLVATHMISRCEAMLNAGVHTVSDAVRSGVLATDALELLGDRTPTTAMDALKLKHMAEVSAECQFSGVEYHIEIKPRLKEIQEEARSLSRWFHRRRKAMAVMNAEMTTVIELMRIFREHGQFDEALICQNRVRHLHNRLWMCQHPGRMVFWPLLKYTEVVLASFGCFLAAISGWMLLFWGLFGCADLTKRVDKDLPGYFEQAFTSFTGTNGFTSDSFTWNLLTVCAVLIGIAHIGIFISHVYMLVSRKD